jgi:hypothetical protein
VVSALAEKDPSTAGDELLKLPEVTGPTDEEGTSFDRAGLAEQFEIISRATGKIAKILTRQDAEEKRKQKPKAPRQKRPKK